MPPCQRRSSRSSSTPSPWHSTSRKTRSAMRSRTPTPLPPNHPTPRAPRQPPLPTSAIIDLQILQWNAYSLRTRAAELRHCISEIRNPPTIICIQETWLQPSVTFEIPGYTCVRHDRTTGTKGGGIATFVKAGVAYSITNTTDDPESISFSIDGLESKITVVNVYHPASPPLQPGFYSRLFAARSGIVLGDFTLTVLSSGVLRPTNEGAS